MFCLFFLSFASLCYPFVPLILIFSSLHYFQWWFLLIYACVLLIYSCVLLILMFYSLSTFPHKARYFFFLFLFSYFFFLPTELCFTSSLFTSPLPPPPPPPPPPFFTSLLCFPLPLYFSSLSFCVSPQIWNSVEEKQFNGSWIEALSGTHEGRGMGGSGPFFSPSLFHSLLHSPLLPSFIPSFIPISFPPSFLPLLSPSFLHRPKERRSW